MSDKFSYIDFLMYIIPGAFLTLVLLFGLCLTEPKLTKDISYDLFASIIFIVFSFVIGNFLQVYSHGKPERRLKKKYWKSYYPSQLMFFQNNMVLDEKERFDLIKACIRTNILSEKETNYYQSSELNDEGIECANRCFNYMRVYLSDIEKGKRIEGAEGYFLFFRGLFVASFWSAVIMFIVFAINCIQEILAEYYIIAYPKTDPFIDLFLPFFLFILFLVFWRTFRYRCRGAAQGFSKEVYRAYCSHVLTKEVKNE